MNTEDKTIRLKHIGLALTSLITNVLAPIVEQVSGNTDDISDLEKRVSVLEAALFGDVAMTADDSTESIRMVGVAANDNTQSIIGKLVADDSTETISVNSVN